VLVAPAPNPAWQDILGELTPAKLEEELKTFSRKRYSKSSL
jgi:hypothetical protein